MPTLTLADTGTAAALATALVTGDRDAFMEVVDAGLPPLPALVAEAAALLRDALWTTTTADLGRDAEPADLAGVWEDHVPVLACSLVLDHGFAPPLVAEVLAWLARVLAGSPEIPATEPCAHAAVALVAAVRGWDEDTAPQWRSLMLGRAVIASHGQ